MGRFTVLIRKLTGWDEIRFRLKIYRALMLAQCSGAFAIVLFIILWLLATTGCVSNDRCNECVVKTHFNLSEEISRITSQMRSAGCFPKDVHVSYTNPTSYSVQVSGPYYEKFDTNKLKGERK